MGRHQGWISVGFDHDRSRASKTLMSPWLVPSPCNSPATVWPKLSALRGGRYLQGRFPDDTLVINFAGDIATELAAQPFARSPIAIAVWGERAPTLEDDLRGY